MLRSVERRRDLKELSKAECLRLLDEVGFGRIVFTSQALPVALPVNFVLDLSGAGGIVFRTAGGSKLSAATSGSVVAFEADAMDLTTGSGWSVLVTGLAHEVHEPDHQRRADALGLHQWGLNQQQSHYICIPISMISGRRVLVTSTDTGASITANGTAANGNGANGIAPHSNGANGSNGSGTNGNGLAERGRPAPSAAHS
jgi:nitroimidazol reductase NimA-like FMN-containing flavoprotein (pyridoxamine 5'-phosphate oxidase superfamily)